jgi:hypothetical protein
MFLALSNERVERGRKKKKVQAVHPKLINVNHTIAWYPF